MVGVNHCEHKKVSIDFSVDLNGVKTRREIILIELFKIVILYCWVNSIGFALNSKFGEFSYFKFLYMSLISVSELCTYCFREPSDF